MRTQLLMLVVLLLAASNLSTAQQVTPGKPASSLTNEPLLTLPKSVLDAELESAVGRPFKLSEYSGKVMVIILWATWVVPSRLETPELVKLQSHFSSQEVRFVGLSVENPATSRRAVRAWVRNFRVPYKIGWVPPDVASTLMQGRDAVPQTFVISVSGRIIRRFIGYNSTETPAQFKQAIEEALKDKVEVSESAKRGQLL